jgi:hypothetical protein
MKILVAAFAYNERPYIPYMVEYYRNQGCDLLILDNYSNDGTYEWLVENNIPTSRVDTNESFFLSKLQAALMDEIAKINPDWVVNTGIDLYYFFKTTIREEIEKADSAGFNMIEAGLFSGYNTGEEFKLPFYKHYLYMQKGMQLQMIAKYLPGFRLEADSIKLPQMNVYVSDGILINYGMCKSKEERESTFARRKKAWELGLHKGWGVHYAPASQRQWIWKKEELIYMKECDKWDLIKRHIHE